MQKEIQEIKRVEQVIEIGKKTPLRVVQEQIEKVCIRHGQVIDLLTELICKGELVVVRLRPGHGKEYIKYQIV